MIPTRPEPPGRVVRPPGSTATPAASASSPTSRAGPAGPSSTPPSSGWPASATGGPWPPTACPATAPGSCCPSRRPSSAGSAREAGLAVPDGSPLGVVTAFLDAADDDARTDRRAGRGRRLRRRAAVPPRVAADADRRHPARGGGAPERPVLHPGDPGPSGRRGRRPTQADIERRCFRARRRAEAACRARRRAPLLRQLVVRHRRLQGAGHERRPVGVLPRPGRLRLRRAAGGVPLPVLDQHHAGLGAGPAVPVPVPQR